MLVDSVTCFKAVHYRHVDVQNDYLEEIARVRFYDVDCFEAILGGRDFEMRLKLVYISQLCKTLVIDKKHSRSVG